MTKIFEALEHANQVRGGEPAELSPLPPQNGNGHGHFSGSPFEAKMVALYQSICSLLPTPQGRVVSFMSSRPGEGTSRMIRQFARVIALRMHKSVVLLDADLHHPGQMSALGLNPAHGWEEAVSGEVKIKEALCSIKDLSLHVGQVSVNRYSAAPFFSLPGLESFFAALRQEHDLILIDCPPVSASSDGLALAEKVDGIVLVAEAEKTRREVVEKVSDTIAQHGGKLLGVALNKRRLYIPKFIYDRI